MKRKIVAFISLMVIFAYGLKGQGKERITFNELSYDFGPVAEEQGRLRYRFEFKVSGSKKVYINKVEASCGCTSPSWVLDTLKENDIGFVEVLYDPSNRAGSFNKTVEVYFNQEDSPFTLTLKGKVIPSRESLEARFPIEEGDLRLNVNKLTFGKLKNNELASFDIQVFNQGSQILIFEDTISAPAYMNINYLPQTLRPGEVGVLRFLLNAENSNELGYLSDELTVYTDEEKEAAKSLSYFAFIENYFPPQTKEMLANAPKIFFDKKIKDFGRVAEGNVLDGEFTIYNKGKSDLVLQKITSNCDCLQVDTKVKKVKAGKKINISFQFNTEGRIGEENKEIIIFSNDPMQSISVLKTKVYVNE